MMKKLTLTVLAASVLALAACNQPAASGGNTAASSAGSEAPKGMESQSQQVSYIIGQQMGEQLLELKNNGGEIDVKLISEGIQDKLEGKSAKLTPEQSEAAMKGFMEALREKAEKKATESKVAGEKFLSENKTKEGIKTTASGLQYKVNKEGTGVAPVMGDGVMVEYTGKLIDGTEFDSTKAHGGEPLAVGLIPNGPFIKGWLEGLQLMKEGGEYTLYIPADLAYGQMASGKIPANSVLVFDMKVVKVEKGAVKDAAKSTKAEKATTAPETKKK